ncbi:MAG: hypothetical protein JRF55_07010, partial [Deltaproteobacteria bacterium]|nr:hypothetical protein [Deltaproteobacteria bacterium]
ARHPSLILGGIDVVPNDIELSGGEALVISGPNAGGKTVALKMLGLAALMTRAGLAVPVEEGSVCGFFSPVLAAVGDEQSLARSLSTFSAHLVTLRSVLEQAGERVLVLLDELAGATDPEAGAALACAIVKTLVERRIRLRQHGADLPDDDGRARRIERPRGRASLRNSFGGHRPGATHAPRAFAKLRDSGGEARSGDQDRATRAGSPRG